MLRIYSDGASRGNPGHSSIAFMILDNEDKVLFTHSEYIGIRTNNQAEYEALILALISTLTYSDKEVICFMDSELVIRQLNREYRVRNQKLGKLWEKILILQKNFKKITFSRIPREDGYILRVDQMAKESLDRKLQEL